MNLRQIVKTVGMPQIDLIAQSGVSRFRMYAFMRGVGTLTEAEQTAILATLLAHGEKVEQALAVLRQVASA